MVTVAFQGNSHWMVLGQLRKNFKKKYWSQSHNLFQISFNPYMDLKIKVNNKILKLGGKK